MRTVALLQKFDNTFLQFFASEIWIFSAEKTFWATNSYKWRKFATAANVHKTTHKTV